MVESCHSDSLSGFVTLVAPNYVMGECAPSIGGEAILLVSRRQDGMLRCRKPYIGSGKI